MLNERLRMAFLCARRSFEEGAYTTVINSDAYRNYDPKKFGGMADGFGPKPP